MFSSENFWIENCFARSDFQTMQGTMRASGPRPQSFGAMRTSTQVPRMTSTQRVGQSLVINQLSIFTVNTVQL